LIGNISVIIHCIFIVGLSPDFLIVSINYDDKNPVGFGLHRWIQDFPNGGMQNMASTECGVGRGQTH